MGRPTAVTRFCGPPAPVTHETSRCPGSPEGEARENDTFSVVERLDERLTEDEEAQAEIDQETDRQLVDLVRERLAYSLEVTKIPARRGPAPEAYAW